VRVQEREALLERALDEARRERAPLVVLAMAGELGAPQQRDRVDVLEDVGRIVGRDRLPVETQRRVDVLAREVQQREMPPVVAAQRRRVRRPRRREAAQQREPFLDAPLVQQQVRERVVRPRGVLVDRDRAARGRLRALVVTAQLERDRSRRRCAP
jgi:hypothetical protein